MKILLTGATGYIAQRLLPVLLDNGHEVTCMVRDSSRFDIGKYGYRKQLTILEVDLLERDSLSFPKDIDAAYYLVHSMSTSGEFSSMEERSARNFTDAISRTA